MKIGQNAFSKTATTEILLENNFIIEVLTMKRYGGAVATSFMIWKKLKEGIKQSAINFKCQSINHGKVRLTEKKLIELHNLALKEKDNFQSFFEQEIKKY
jgi:hypothetical protein